MINILDQLNASLNLIVAQTTIHLKSLAIILAIPWFVFLLTSVEKRFLYLGIIPRHAQGIPGILLAPLLHANFNHLFFNSIPLIVLSNFLLINGLNFFILTTLIITLLSGFLIWCFAKPGLHIGASALITGYWAFLVSNIFREGTLIGIILGVISLYYFAGIFLGIFPSKKGVSWEGHLFGMLAGFTLSYFIS